MPFVPFVPFRRGSGSEPPSPRAEAALLQRVADSDGAALERIYRQHAGPVYRYALALCANPAWAAEPEGFDAARGRLGGYLAGIARDALAARWRQAGHESPLDDTGAEDGGTAASAAETSALERGEHAASPETLLVQRQDGAAVWGALHALPAIFREALLLVDVRCVWCLEPPFEEDADEAP